jgi:hypothetical protein
MGNGIPLPGMKVTKHAAHTECKHTHVEITRKLR